MRETLAKEISLTYEKRRLAAQEALDRRISQIYSQFPEIEEIDYQIKMLGVFMSKNIIFGNTEKAEEIKEKIAVLKEKKSALLSDRNIPPQWFRPKFTCEKCQDTGFITNNTKSEKCSCYRALVIESLYKNFSLDPNRTMTFENFDISLYPDISDKDRFGVEGSPKEKALQNYNICLNFVEKFSDLSVKNILLFGRSGVGKTFMCGCVANALIEKGIPVLYLSATEMFNIISSERMGKAENIYHSAKIEDLITTELLIIDDLGTESPTVSRYAEFLEILNKRKELNGKRPCKMIISTNLTPKEIYGHYSERIGSRILGEFVICRFIGEDIRMIDR